jgi:hypothetical protein
VIETKKLTGFVPDRMPRNTVRILKVSLMESIPRKWFASSVTAYQYSGPKTVEQLAHDDWGGLFNECISGNALVINFERNSENYNHMIFKPVGIQDMGDGMGVSFGLALENFVGLNFNPRYFNVLTVSNNTEGKSFKITTPLDMKPFDVSGYGSIIVKAQK